MRERSHGRRLRCMTDSIWHDSHRHRMCPLGLYIGLYITVNESWWIEASMLTYWTAIRWLSDWVKTLRSPVRQKNRWNNEIMFWHATYAFVTRRQLAETISITLPSVYLFIYLFVCLFICLHNISFKREVIACDILHWVKQSAHVE